MSIDRSSRLAVLLVASLLPARLAAQEATLELKGTTDKFTVGEPPVSISIPSAVGSKTIIKVHCFSPFDCTKIAWSGAAVKRVQKQPGLVPTGAEAVFELPGGPTDAPFALKLSHENKPSDNVVEFKPANVGNIGDDPGVGDIVAEALTTACQVPTLNDGSVVLTVFGRPLTPLPKAINTETQIKTRVLVDARIAHLIDPREGSELAAPVITNIFGAGEAPFANKSTGTKPEHACVLTSPVDLGPFASPKGTIDIAVNNGEVKVVGSRSFRVVPLYTGMFTLGGMSTRVAAPVFEKVYNGTDTLVSARETGRRVLYTAMYTHFLRKRGLIGPPSDLRDVVSPMVGVVMNDVPNNALYGVNFTLWSGLSVVAGWHTARVSEIDPASGAVDGKPYANRSATIPTRNTWKTDRFWGISLDAQAASGLLKSIFANK